MRTYHALAVTCLFLFSLQACAPENNLMPTALTSAATRAESPATVAPTESPSTPTPPPAPSATPAPEGLSPSGPYILYGGSAGIWLTNPDGSFPTQLSYADASTVDLRALVSPSGGHMTLVEADEMGLDLYIVSLPGGEKQKIAHLLDLTQQDLLDATSPRAITSYAITGYSNIAWNPVNESLLAFVGAVNGPTSDLYLYDMQTGEVSQLTSGVSQAIMPSWSPDGKYILHYGVSWVPPFGGAILGYNRIDGAWAVRASDGKILPQPKPKGKINFVGWQDDSHYMIFDSDEKCYSVNLRNVNVVDGKTSPVMDFSFYYEIAQSPENMALLFSAAEGCASSPGEGTFLLLPGNSKPVKLIDKKTYEVRWLPESSVFQAYPEALFSSDGKTRYDPPVYDKSYQPAISKKGFEAWEVIENQQGRVEITSPNNDWTTIMKGLVDELIWDPVTGETLLIAMEDGSLYAASAPDFSPKLVGNFGGRISQAIWIP